MRTIAGRMKGGHWTLSREDYEAVCAALEAGNLIVYPTDTLYGLGCDPFEDRAVERLYEMKRRPAEQPIALAVSSPEQVSLYGHMGPLAATFCARHLPGPVTVLLRATNAAPPALVSAEGLIGIRVPDHSVATAIARAFGPVTTTSANLHGGPSPATCEEARDQLGDAVELYVDCGPTRHGKESTIVDLSGDQTKVIREGALRRDEL
jgi:L-threonylcarbamoyladenylate synthase